MKAGKLALSRKVVVTGGAGFVGSHVVQAFVERGYHVTVIDNGARRREFVSVGGRHRQGSDSTSYNSRYLAHFPKVETLRGSVEDARLLKSVISDADFVVHLAAQVAVTKSLAEPARDFQSNVLGTFNLLEACRLARSTPRIVYASTNKVYGSNVNKIPVVEDGTRYRFADRSLREGISEDFEIDHTQHSPYGVSKLAGDLYTQEYGYTYGLNTGVFRMSCIYGPRQVGVADQGWIAHFVLTALRHGRITIYGDGKQVRDALYVSDLVSAYRFYLESKLGPEVFNIGGGRGNTISLTELIAFLSQRLSRTVTTVRTGWRPADQRVYVSDVRRLKRVLNWRPETSLRTGLNKLFDWAARFLRLEHMLKGSSDE